MAVAGIKGDPWKAPMYIGEGSESGYIAARAGFQLLDSVMLFGLFGLTCFVRYGVPCVARRSRFQGEVYHFKALSFALLTYATTSALNGSQYAVRAALDWTTYGFAWLGVMGAFFRSVAYCSTFFVYYRIINWFLHRILKESKIVRIVDISHWIFFAAMCGFNLATWVILVFSNCYSMTSLDAESIKHWGIVYTNMSYTEEIIWWIVSLEQVPWLVYSCFHTYRSKKPAARNAGIFALVGSFILFGMCLMWAANDIKWGLLWNGEEEEPIAAQLAVIILELFFTTSIFLGLLLTCMKLAVLGDDLDDKAYTPAVWKEDEEEARPVSQDVSRPVSPIGAESEYNLKGMYKHRYASGNGDPAEMDSLRPVCEVEGSSEMIREMDGDSRQKIIEMEGSTHKVLEMEGSKHQTFEMEGSTYHAVEVDSGLYEFPKGEKSQ